MFYAIAAVLVLIADQWLKYWVTTNIALGTGVKNLIPGVISLINTHNDGAAFSMLKGGGWRWAFVAIAVIFVMLVIYALSKNLIKHPLGRWSAVGVVAGAIGNGIDRVMQGYVVDMFRLDFMSYAIFNLADIFISCSGVLFCIYIIFIKDDDEKKSERGSAQKRHRVSYKATSDAHIYVPSASKSAPGRPYSIRSKDHTPVTLPKLQPQPYSQPIDSRDPFAEWEELEADNSEPRFNQMVGGPVEAPFTKAGTASPHVPPAQTPQAYEISSPTAPEREPAMLDLKPKSDEFSLEDILAEFSSNE